MSRSERIRPKRRFILSMHPYLPIEKNEDGSGGGIQLRVYGDEGNPHFIDVVWGEKTEIEVVCD
jgi:hypothetical protein